MCWVVFGFLAFVLFSFAILTQTSIVWQEETSAENMPSSDYPVEKSMSRILD